MLVGSGQFAAEALERVMTDTDRLSELRASARGWHGVQLAALGFIGLCGVLQSSGNTNPRWLQITAGVLILLALVLSCLAIGWVAAAAWPLYGSARSGQLTGEGTYSPAEYAQEVRRTGRRLRRGISATFLAVALTALGATSSWWPHRGAEAALVQVTTSDAVACGELRDARPGVLALDSGGRQVAFALSDVVALRSVPACG